MTVTACGPELAKLSVAADEGGQPFHLSYTAEERSRMSAGHSDGIGGHGQDFPKGGIGRKDPVTGEVWYAASYQKMVGDQLLSLPYELSDYRPVRPGDKVRVVGGDGEVMEVEFFQGDGRLSLLSVRGGKMWRHILRAKDLELVPEGH